MAPAYLFSICSYYLPQWSFPVPGKMRSPGSLSFLFTLHQMYCPQMFAWMDIFVLFRLQLNFCLFLVRPPQIPPLWYSPTVTFHLITLSLLLVRNYFLSQCDYAYVICFFSSRIWSLWEEGPLPSCTLLCFPAVNNAWQYRQTISISRMNESDLVWDEHILFMVHGNILFKLYKGL